MIYLIWTILFLGVCTFTDLKGKSIYGIWCGINGIAGFLANLVTESHSFLNIGAGVAIGLVFIAVALITKQKLGVGDGIVMLTMGFIIGGDVSFSVIIWAFISCTVFSITGLITGKIKLNSSLPFMPFMLTGSIITLIIQEV